MYRFRRLGRGHIFRATVQPATWHEKISNLKSLVRKYRDWGFGTNPFLLKLEGNLAFGREDGKGIYSVQTLQVLYIDYI